MEKAYHRGTTSVLLRVFKRVLTEPDTENMDRKGTGFVANQFLFHIPYSTFPFFQQFVSRTGRYKPCTCLKLNSLLIVIEGNPTSQCIARNFAILLLPDGCQPVYGQMKKFFKYQPIDSSQYIVKYSEKNGSRKSQKAYCNCHGSKGIKHCLPAISC